MNRRTSSQRVRQHFAEFCILMVPGLHGSGPMHWQSYWQRRYPAFGRVGQDQWDIADLSAWSTRLLAEVARCSQPAVLVAHSFGCLTTVHGNSLAAGNIAGALLVAPADPEKFRVADQVQESLSFPSIVIGSDNDPWMSAARARHWASIWGSEFVNAGALGHINADSALGEWPMGLDLLDGLIYDLVRMRTGAPAP